MRTRHPVHRPASREHLHVFLLIRLDSPPEPSHGLSLTCPEPRAGPAHSSTGDIERKPPLLRRSVVLRPEVNSMPTVPQVMMRLAPLRRRFAADYVNACFVPGASFDYAAQRSADRVGSNSHGPAAASTTGRRDVGARAAQPKTRRARKAWAPGPAATQGSQASRGIRFAVALPSTGACDKPSRRMEAPDGGKTSQEHSRGRRKLRFRGQTGEVAVVSPGFCDASRGLPAPGAVYAQRRPSSQGATCFRCNPFAFASTSFNM